MTACEIVTGQKPDEKPLVSAGNIEQERRFIKSMGARVFGAPPDVTLEKYPHLAQHVDPRSNGTLFLRFTEETFLDLVDYMKLTRSLTKAIIDKRVSEK